MVLDRLDSIQPLEQTKASKNSTPRLKNAMLQNPLVAATKQTKRRPAPQGANREPSQRRAPRRKPRGEQLPKAPTASQADAEHPAENQEETSSPRRQPRAKRTPGTPRPSDPSGGHRTSTSCYYQNGKLQSEKTCADLSMSDCHRIMPSGQNSSSTASTQAAFTWGRNG